MVQAIPEAHEMDAAFGQCVDELVVNLVVHGITCLAQRKVRLIGNQNERKAGALQLSQCWNGSVDEAEVGRPQRRLHASCTGVQDCRVDDAVAIDKDSGAGYLADSHFIG
jgi:hypothetical protein